jgi:predicted small lipoprotein YifL
VSVSLLIRTIVKIFLVLLLVSCGSKGDLFLSDEKATEQEQTDKAKDETIDGELSSPEPLEPEARQQ